MKSILVHYAKQKHVGKKRGGVTKDYYIHTLETNILNKRKGKTTQIRSLIPEEQRAGELQQALILIS